VPQHDPLIGALLGDRYRITERIGAGGMGAVYRGVHTALKRDVAIKVLLPELGDKDEFIRRFEREAESASRLAHPNIIAVTDFGRTPEGLLFLAMEFLDGQSLTSMIRKGPMEIPRAMFIMRQVLNALGHAHAAGVVHRDLKPDNIMLVTRDGQSDVVKILDFGIAKVTDPGGGSGVAREALTQAGMIFGTPEYLSPEQALGDTVDARADLYAAGVILFEMLTARRPFESEDKVRIISMHLSHPPPRLAQANPNVQIPAPIEEVVAQSLEKQREHRFVSAGAFLAALGEAETEVGRLVVAAETDAAATAAAVARPPDVPPVRMRRTWRRAALGAACGLALAGAGWALLQGRSVQFKSPPKTVATSPVGRPAVPPAELGARVRVVEGLLGAGEIVKARVALEQLLAENPGNARVRYLLGRLAFADDHHLAALDDYREAIALDAGFRGDPILIDHLGVALGEARAADAALDLAIERVGRPAADLLERVANGGGDLRRRQRAARALSELGEERRVDTVSLRSAELRKATNCEDKKAIVTWLAKADDPRALPVLRSQRSRGGIEGFLGAEPNNACMKTELADAIAKLEAKLPADKRPPARPPGHHSVSSHPSIFRGR
jgi:serine/threonine-protein kinase